MPGTSHSGGRNRKSNRAHALAGTGRKDRGTKPPTTSAAAPPPPDPPVGRPRTPSWLTGYALSEWTRMVERLEDAKTLTTVDDAVLYQYCCLFAETEAIVTAHRTNVALVDTLQAAIEKWTRLVDLIEAAAAKKGDPLAAAIETQKYGAQILVAILQIVQLKKLEGKHSAQLRQGHMALRQYLVELGMTPAARSRVTEVAGAGAKDAPVDPFAEFDTPAGAKH